MSNQTAVVKKQQVINLDKAIVVRSQDGSEIRRMKTLMKLNVADGSLVKIMDAKKGYGDYPDRPATLIPTANAYMQMASKCGISVRHPDTVIVGGIEQPNGYCSPDGTYYFRSQAGGYTANGQPFITDRTVDFNVARYNIQDLLAKAKSDKNTRYFKVKPFLGKDKNGSLLGAPTTSWAGYQIDDAVVLWVDCECPQLISWLGEMNNRKKNAIRVAQTFADRNAIAAHPALPMKKKFETPEATLELIQWIAKAGQNTFKMLEEESTHVTIDVESASLNEDGLREEVAADTTAVPLDASDAPAEPEGDEDNLQGVKPEAEKSAKKKEEKPAPAETAKKEPAKSKLKPLKTAINREEVCVELDSLESSLDDKTVSRLREEAGTSFETTYDKMTDDQLVTLRSLIKAAM
jgi:hypothetical protein